MPHDLKGEGAASVTAAARSLMQIAAERPLIHHITNVVVANDVANLTLAFGARPVMAEAREEVAEITAVARVLVLNLGMPSAMKIEAMLVAGHAAAMHGIPIVLDPVGAGATHLRTTSALRLLAEVPITVVRGNRGELGALVGAGAVSGVDALGTEEPQSIARAVAAHFQTVAAVTGAVDVVAGENVAYAVGNGHALLPRITGSGCMASAAIGIFLTAGADAAAQAALALAVYGLAAERAATPVAGGEVPGPGTFRGRLMDEVASLVTTGVHGLRIDLLKEPASRGARPVR